MSEEEFLEWIRFDKDKFVQETAEDVIKNLTDEDKASLLQHSDYVEHHFGLGLYIRNHYIHGKPVNATKFPFGADGASHEIFDRVIELLKEESD